MPLPPCAVLIGHGHEKMKKVENEGASNLVVPDSFAVFAVALKLCNRPRSWQAAGRNHVVYSTHLPYPSF